MKRTLQQTLLFFLLLIYWSCEKEVKNVKLPETDPQLVVYAYLSPSNSLIQVHVFKSIPFFGKNREENDELVEDAFVQLTSNGKSVQLNYDPQLEQYVTAHSKEFPILPGRKYQLNVSAPGGFSCSAETTVPAGYPQDFYITVDSSNQVNSDGFEVEKYRIIGYWKDQPGTSNYYRHVVSTISSFDFNFDTDICNTLLTDRDKDGREISTSCTYQRSFFGQLDPAFTENDSAFLLNVDFAYYSYHESYYRYEDDNPFSEPVQIYTNVEGGLGCFGSYLKVSAPLVR